MIAKAKAEALAEAAASSHETTDGEPPPLPVSPSEAQDGPPEPRGSLLWDPERLRAVPWLAEFADVPEDASPPLWMSPPPADAVGTYGPECIEWIEEQQGHPLRWWQRLAITRQMEHREDGSLCHALVIESTPRRAGKSVRMRGVALWRLEDPEGLWDETQLVMHTGSDLNICREIQRQAWRWAEAQGWVVTRANGKESIESDTGSRWLTRSQDGVYGYDVTYAPVDEAWNVKPETVSEGIEPATLERISPQVHLTSTAHRRATSLMRGRISTALVTDDPETLLLVWGAPPDTTVEQAGDPDVWRAASPHWSEERRNLIARKYAAAVAGQADPQMDDPDPMAGFIAQYLNVWNLRPRKAVAEPVLDLDALAAGNVPGEFTLDMAKRLVVALDVSPGLDHVTLVGGAALDDGRIRTKVLAEWESTAEALAALPELLKILKPRARYAFLSGPADAIAPDLTSLRFRDAGKATTASQGLSEFVSSRRLLHDGNATFLTQAAEATKVPSGDGWKFIRRGEPCDAVYAVAACVTTVRTKHAKKAGIRVLLPTET